MCVTCSLSPCNVKLPLMLLMVPAICFESGLFNKTTLANGIAFPVVWSFKVPVKFFKFWPFTTVCMLKRSSNDFVRFLMIDLHMMIDFVISHNANRINELQVCKKVGYMPNICCRKQRITFYKSMSWYE